MSATPPAAPTPPVKPAAAELPPPMNEVGVLRALVQVVRARVLSGLIAVMPVVLTLVIVQWLYRTAVAALTPLIAAVQYVLGNRGLSAWYWDRVVAPVIAVVLIVCLLYLLGLFVRTRVLATVDWVMLRLPVVNTIFKAIRNVFESLGQQLQGSQGFKRVVLVEFPNPGMRSLGFVTNTLRDATTDRPIVCVTVLTGVMPPQGFTLFVPEEAVTDIDWTMNQTLQAILSGGITAPATIHYAQGVPKASVGGPLVDSHGNVVAVPRAAGPDAPGLWPPGGTGTAP